MTVLRLPEQSANARPHERQADDAPVLKHGTARFTLRPMDRLLDGTCAVIGPWLLSSITIVLANVRTSSEDATLWRIDRDGATI